MVGSLDLVRFPLGIAQRELRRATRRGFAKDAIFSRLLLTTWLQSMPIPVPQLTSLGYFAIWPDLAALQRFRSTSVRSWQNGKRHLALDLEPVQSFGAWMGDDPLHAHKSDPRPGPVLLITHSRTRARSLGAFVLADRHVVRALKKQDGRLWSGGYIDGLSSLEAGTLSLWRDVSDATRFAYAPGIHQETVKAERDEGWFAESWFGRFGVFAAQGDWRGIDVETLNNCGLSIARRDGSGCSEAKPSGRCT